MSADFIPQAKLEQAFIYIIHKPTDLDKGPTMAYTLIRIDFSYRLRIEALLAILRICALINVQDGLTYHLITPDWIYSKTHGESVLQNMDVTTNTHINCIFLYENIGLNYQTTNKK